MTPTKAIESLPEEVPVKRRRAYTCNSVRGFWPTGFAAVVYAENASKAADILNAHLCEMGLPDEAQSYQMELFPKKNEECRILYDGDY
jgi:hypothetical protein